MLITSISILRTYDSNMCLFCCDYNGSSDGSTTTCSTTAATITTATPPLPWEPTTYIYIYVAPQRQVSNLYFLCVLLGCFSHVNSALQDCHSMIVWQQ